jgi:transketolase
MREIFPEFIFNELKKNKNIKILLGDIGVYGFRKVFKKYKKNILNFGVMEQSMTSLACGMALKKKIPFIHTIAPFLVNRAFEQIKIDACYQNLNINIISTGASIDYAPLGPTHHCPEDIGVLNNLPNIKIFIPGNSIEFKECLKQYKMKSPKYYRMSKFSHSLKIKVMNNYKVLKKGKRGLIIIIGPSLRFVENFYNEIDANIIYLNCINYKKLKILKKFYKRKIILIHDFYVETITGSILSVFEQKPISLKEIGLPKIFFKDHGEAEDYYKRYNLTPNKIKIAIKSFFY